MKATIEIDCTAAEARELLGLPDVKAVQDEWVRRVADKLEENVQNFSPDVIVKNWVAGAGGGADILSTMLSGFVPGSSNKKKS